MLDQALAGHGLSSHEFGLYSLLRGFGPVTPTQIARWTGMPATTLSAALRRLTPRGHLERMPHPDDGRSYLVVLTTRRNRDPVTGRPRDRCREGR